MSEHHATFTWGAGPNSVHISGGFNNWSATASPLHKQADGTFKGDIALPWGEKQAFKYVVDGEWKVREDEAKEWDAAGNMNNVYTAPHAPAKTESATSPIAAASPVAASSTTPATTERSTEATPVSAHKTEPSTLLASAAPAAVSTGYTEPSTTSHSSGLGNFGLGAPIGGAVVGALGGAAAGRATTASAPPLGASAPPTAVLPPTPATTGTTHAPSALAQTSTKSTSPAEAIERTAAKANVGEAATSPHEDSILEKASAIGATALAGIGAYVGAAAVAVEKATGVDLTHGQPLTIDEAKAAGLDLNRIEKRDGPTDTISPVGTKPPSAAIDDLDRKINDLKVGSSSEAVKAEHHNNDIPAQNEATNDHKTVPMPVITPISDKDPKKDRSIEGASAAESASPKPISTDPSISAKVAKVEAEHQPTTTGATLSQANSGSASAPVAGPAATGPLAGGAVVSPNTPAINNITTPKQESTLLRKEESIEKSSLPVKDTTHETSKPTPVVGLVNASSLPATTPATASTGTAAAPAAAIPAAPAVVAAPAAVAPSTPTKATPVAQNGTPSSIQTTPASTPVKGAHGKEATAGSDVRKRKSSIFHKIKSAFSPKDKEKK